MFFSDVLRCYLNACAISTSRISGDELLISHDKCRSVYILYQIGHIDIFTTLKLGFTMNYESFSCKTIIVLHIQYVPEKRLPFDVKH